MIKQLWYSPKTLLIHLVLAVGVALFLFSTTTGKVFAQTTPTLPATAQCIKAEVEKSINQLREGETAAFDALVACNSEAVPALIQALKDEDKNVRIVAIAILGEIGSEATEAIPFLAEFLKDQSDENRDSRVMVVNTLGKLGQAAIPNLIAALQDEDIWVRSNVASALGQIGQDAKEAVLALIAPALEASSSNVTSLSVADIIISYRRTNPLVMCRFPVVRAILRWKCRK